MASSSVPSATNPPAGKPPLGIEPNFVNPTSRSYVFVAVGSTLLAVMILMFAIRVFAKFYIVKRRSWDDLSCLAGFLGSTLFFVAAYEAVTIGRYGTHNWDVPLRFLGTNDFLVTSYCIDAWQTPVWYFTKLTFLLFYLELFRPLKWMRYSCYTCITVMTLFYIAYFVAQLYLTTPSPGQTWAESFASPRFQHIGSLSIPITAVGLGFDIFILILPLAAISTLQLSGRRKIGVVLMLMVGLGAVIASLLTLIFKIQEAQNSSDFLYSVLGSLTAGFCEMCVGVICSCMPSLSLLANHPDSKRLWSKLKSTNHSIRGSTLTGRSSGKASKHEFPSGKRTYANIKENFSTGSSDPLDLDLELGRVGQFNSFETHVGTDRHGKPPVDGLYRTTEVEQWSVERSQAPRREIVA